MQEGLLNFSSSFPPSLPPSLSPSTSPSLPPSLPLYLYFSPSSPSARYSNVLSQRTHYGFHGFYFLYLFTYKYFVDTSFIFVSCTSLNRESVSV